VLDVQAFADKVLTRKRGCFCFELIGLLAKFLEELGYLSIQRFRAQVSIGKNDLDGAPLFDNTPGRQAPEAIWSRM
jgi:arylamine N-acetyltransferase